MKVRVTAQVQEAPETSIVPRTEWVETEPDEHGNAALEDILRHFGLKLYPEFPELVGYYSEMGED